MPCHRRQPRREHLGSRERAEQHAIVAPAVGRSPQHRRVDVGHAAKQPVRLRAQHCTALPSQHVWNRLLPELLLHEIDDDAGDVVREPLQVARELPVPLFVRTEREGLGEPRPVAVVRDESGTRDDQYAARGHREPIPAATGRTRARISMAARNADRVTRSTLFVTDRVDRSAPSAADRLARPAPSAVGHFARSTQPVAGRAIEPGNQS